MSLCKPTSSEAEQESSTSRRTLSSEAFSDSLRQKLTQHLAPGYTTQQDGTTKSRQHKQQTVGTADLQAITKQTVETADGRTPGDNKVGGRNSRRRTLYRLIIFDTSNKRTLHLARARTYVRTRAAPAGYAIRNHYQTFYP